MYEPSLRTELGSTLVTLGVIITAGHYLAGGTILEQLAAIVIALGALVAHGYVMRLRDRPQPPQSGVRL